MFHRLLALLFPPRCVLCRNFLTEEETDFCHQCRIDAPEYKKSNSRFSFLAGWTVVWYYKNNVRSSILRFKFYGRRSYAPAYGRVLAMELQTSHLDNFDILTWVPIAFLRRMRRGYDQVELLARAVGRELGMEPVRTLRKIRHNRPQAGISGAAQRRANVLGVYAMAKGTDVREKRVLILDDVITTGSTAGECARVLLTAGAKEVHLGCIAAAHSDHK